MLNFRCSISRGWVITVAGLLVAAISLGTRFSFGIFFTTFQEEFMLGRAAVSSVVSVYMVVATIMSVLAGWALDRFGPRRVVTVMGIFAGSSMLISSRVTELWQLYLTYSLLLAIGCGGTMVVVTSTVTRWFRDSRGLALSIVGSGQPVGTMVMAPVSTLLLFWLGWRPSFVLLGVIVLVSVVLLAQLFRAVPTTDSNQADAVRVKPSGATQTGPTLRDAAKSIDFWALGSIGFIMAWSLMLVLTHLVPAVTDAGISATVAAGMLSISSGCNVLARIIAGWLVDHIDSSLLAVTGTIIQAAALVGLIFANATWAYYLFAVAFGFSWGAMSLVTIHRITGRFIGPSLGLILGTLDMFFISGAAVGPYVGGIVYDLTGSYTIAFGVTGALMVLCGLIILMSTGKGRRFGKSFRTG